MTLDIAALETTADDFAFGPIDLTVGDEVLAVLGPSGSGKTTLLSLIAGTRTPDAGSVRLDGRELVGRSLDDRRVGMVFQDGALFPHMTARENVAYAADDKSRVDDLATLLELDGVLDRRPPTLSGGEAQRVALARTLAADPDALLLDEPLSSLDAPIRRRLREQLHDLFATLDIPILVVTHDQRTATALGDRIAVVRDGALEQVGSPSTILDRPASRFVARFTGTENLLSGRVVDRIDEGARVEVGPLSIQTTADARPGATVTVCCHPSRLELAGPDDGLPTDGLNTFAGRVVRSVNEGGEYRIEIALGAGSITIVASARPPTVERLGIETGVDLRVQVPPAALHLLPESGES